MDGSFFDPAELIDFAAQVYGINPQVILAILQRENSAVTAQNRLEDKKLKLIMNYNTSNPTTITDQILDGTAQLRRNFDKLSKGQPTINGWQVGVGKNAIDGKKLLVTPANKAVAASFSYDPEVGYLWDKTSIAGGNALFCKMWKQFGFVKCRPEDILTITGSDTTTRNSTKQYTATGCPSAVTWSVSGSGATISSNGLLTAGATACGKLTGYCNMFSVWDFCNAVCKGNGCRTVDTDLVDMV